jgi:outer membrane protein
VKPISGAVCRAIVLLGGFLALPGMVEAQERVPDRLSLEDALRIARLNNPELLQAQNDLDLANWDVRSAYGALLPDASLNSGISWQGSGEQNFGGITTGELGFADQPSFLFSSYNLSSSVRLSGQSLLAPSQQKARRRATRANILSNEARLGFLVTQSYLAVLRETEALALAEQELERAEFNARLARGQRDVGAATGLDVAQAEVAVGRARVTLLQSQTALRTANLRLAQQIGLPLGDDPVLTTSFELDEPIWTEAGLYGLALESNPDLSFLRSSESAAGYDVKIARSSYLPSLSLSAGISGFTREASNTDFQVQQAMAQADGRIAQCEALNELYRRLSDPLPTADCTAFAFSDATRQQIVAANDVFPFDFTTSPPTLSVGISIPIFQGLSRQRQVEAAQVARDDLRHRVRAQELQLSTDIAAGLAAVRTGYEGAIIEEQNQGWASEQLRLAQEQYRLGLVSFLELVEAETVKAQADRALIDAIFTYHENVSSLESVVGTELRSR